LTEEQIKLILKENKLAEFGSLLKIIKDSKFIYQVLIEIPKEVIKHEGKGEVSMRIIEDIVNLIKKGKLARKDVKHVMTEIVKGKSFEDSIKIEKVDLTKLEAEIVKMIKEKPGLSIAGYMGLVMGKFKGKISGAEANAILQKILNRKF